MKSNLLKNNWTNLDLFELRPLLNERIGGPGQSYKFAKNPNKLYLPSHGSSCRISLTFKDNEITAIEPGPAFDGTQWELICEEVEKSLLAGPPKVGREYSFSSFRVLASWRGERSGVQILPPPDDAPRADEEVADHPFILEFPMVGSDSSVITNHRRLREHRKLTLLLNVLLAGRTSLPPRRCEHFWAIVSRNENRPEIKWVQQFFFAKLGEAVIDELSSSAGERLEQVDPDEYYTEVAYDLNPAHSDVSRGHRTLC